MLIERLFAVGQGIDKEVAGALVDFIGKILWRSGGFFERVIIGQRSQNRADLQCARLGVGHGHAKAHRQDQTKKGETGDPLRLHRLSLVIFSTNPRVASIFPWPSTFSRMASVCAASE